jgi:hypothetical protein
MKVNQYCSIGVKTTGDFGLIIVKKSVQKEGGIRWDI